MENNAQISCLIPSSICVCVSLSFYLYWFQETFEQMVHAINKISLMCKPVCIYMLNWIGIN